MNMRENIQVLLAEGQQFYLHDAELSEWDAMADMWDQAALFRDKHGIYWEYSLMEPPHLLPQLEELDGDDARRRYKLSG
jgi:hypothetical protein